MKKFDCIKDRVADIPDRTNKSTRQDLKKVKDYVALKFDCPRIEINGKYDLKGLRDRVFSSPELLGLLYCRSLSTKLVLVFRLSSARFSGDENGDNVNVTMRIF